jgi:hypothetical protein
LRHWEMQSGSAVCFFISRLDGVEISFHIAVVG